jgi:hypothetical protein
MSEKPSPPKTMRGFVGDSMSTANLVASVNVVEFAV